MVDSVLVQDKSFAMVMKVGNCANLFFLDCIAALMAGVSSLRKIIPLHILSALLY